MIANVAEQHKTPTGATSHRFATDRLADHSPQAAETSETFRPEEYTPGFTRFQTVEDFLAAVEWHLRHFPGTEPPRLMDVLPELGREAYVRVVEEFADLAWRYFQGREWNEQMGLDPDFANPFPEVPSWTDATKEGFLQAIDGDPEFSRATVAILKKRGT